MVKIINFNASQLVSFYAIFNGVYCHHMKFTLFCLCSRPSEIENIKTYKASIMEGYIKFNDKPLLSYLVSKLLTVNELKTMVDVIRLLVEIFPRCKQKRVTSFLAIVLSFHLCNSIVRSTNLGRMPCVRSIVYLWLCVLPLNQDFLRPSRITMPF